MGQIGRSWCGEVRCGVVWCGVVRCGVVWFGVAWRGVVRSDVVWDEHGRGGVVCIMESNAQGLCAWCEDLNQYKACLELEVDDLISQAPRVARVVERAIHLDEERIY